MAGLCGASLTVNINTECKRHRLYCRHAVGHGMLSDQHMHESLGWYWSDGVEGARPAPLDERLMPREVEEPRERT